MSVNNVLVRGSSGDGVSLSDHSIIAEFTGLISTGNARSASTSVEVASTFGPDSQLTGNSLDAVSIINSTVDTATAWQKIDVPYLLDRIDVDAPLSIPAGAELRFESGGVLEVGSDGSLSAIGTEADPIVFTGQEMTPGYWNGIKFRFSNSTNNRLEHAVIEYAGSNASDGGGLFVIAFSSSPARVAVADTIFRNNDGPGFRFSDNITLTEFRNILSTGNGISGAHGSRYGR